MPNFASIAVVAAGLALAFDARAGGLELTWEAPAECPDGARVRADIEALAGRDLSRPSEAITRVIARASRDDLAWLAVVTITSPGGAPSERRIEGKTCREVADAVAAIVALALVTPPEPPVTPPPVVSPPVVAAPKPPPPIEAAPDVGGMIAVLGGVDFAALPHPSAGFGVMGALRFFEKNRVELRAAGFLPQAEALEGAGVDVALFAASLRYCRVLFGDVASLTACGGFEGGAMIASAFGFEANEDGVGRWLAPELALQLEVHPIPALGLHLEAEGLLPIARDYFLIDDDRVYRPLPVDVRSLLGISFSAP